MTRHRYDMDLGDTAILVLHRIVSGDSLPLVGLIPTEFRQLGGTYWQAVCIVEGVRTEALDELTIGVDSHQRIGVGWVIGEGQQVLVLRAILCCHIDGVLQVACDHIYYVLRSLLWLGIDIWHRGLAHWQVNKVGVMVRVESRQRFAI